MTMTAKAGEPDRGRTMSEFAAACDTAELLPDVITKIKHLLIDTIGVTIAGSREPHAYQARCVALEPTNSSTSAAG